MRKTIVPDKPKRKVSEEHKKKLQDNLAKAREAQHQGEIAQDQQPDIDKAGTGPDGKWEYVRDNLELQTAEAKPKGHFGFRSKKDEQVETVLAIVADNETIIDDPIQIGKSKLPSGAFQLLYKGNWVYPLVEISGNGTLEYEPWPLMNPKDEAESKLPPENLGMVTYFPEATAYYVRGKNPNEKLNVALAIGLLVGLGVLFFSIFTVGMG